MHVARDNCFVLQIHQDARAIQRGNAKGTRDARHTNYRQMTTTWKLIAARYSSTHLESRKRYAVKRSYTMNLGKHKHWLRHSTPEPSEWTCNCDHNEDAGYRRRNNYDALG